jgi:phosphosulfolactate phosphohydrolase-like enzyme
MRSADTVKALRALATREATTMPPGWADAHALYSDAADEIEALRQRAEAAEAERDRLAEYLGRIARQKRSDELETEADVEYADFTDGFDACVNVARAAALRHGEGE